MRLATADGHIDLDVLGEAHLCACCGEPAEPGAVALVESYVASKNKYARLTVCGSCVAAGLAVRMTALARAR